MSFRLRFRRALVLPSPRTRSPILVGGVAAALDVPPPPFVVGCNRIALYVPAATIFLTDRTHNSGPDASYAHVD